MKAFDNINRNVIIKILKIIKIDYRYRRNIRELYKHRNTSIKIKYKPQLEKERGKVATYCRCYLIRVYTYKDL
jgi:hypothetical protein